MATYMKLKKTYINGLEVTLQFYSGFIFGEKDEGERQVKRAFILMSDLLIFFTEMHVCSFFQWHVKKKHKKKLSVIPESSRIPLMGGRL